MRTIIHSDDFKLMYPESIRYYAEKGINLAIGLGFIIAGNANGLNEMLTYQALDELEHSLQKKYTLKKAVNELA